MFVVMPTLVLNYFGQGAMLLSGKASHEHLFFAMVPPGIATYALVALSTCATVIASQALISGAFSLTHQAVQLGLFPRVDVTHTSQRARPDLHTRHQLGAGHRLSDPRAHVPELEPTRLGLRHCGHRDHGDHVDRCTST